MKEHNRFKSMINNGQHNLNQMVKGDKKQRALSESRNHSSKKSEKIQLNMKTLNIEEDLSKT